MPVRSTEALNPAAEDLHALPPETAMARLLLAQQTALEAVTPAIPALVRTAEAAAAALRAGGRLGYAGAGSSGLMALADCLELPGTFGLDPAQTPMIFAGGAGGLLRMAGGVEDDAAAARDALAKAGLAAGDVVLVVSASGTTPYALAVAHAARAQGVTVAGVANVAGAALLEAADIPVLLETGAEMVAGSTRLGAASAQKVALNMISVMVGLRLGHVHRGRMVNLLADNAKLGERAARIVAELAEVPPAAAEAALARSGGAVKTAILVARGRSPDEAEAALQAAGGDLTRIGG
ncbi:N-acetylmuramic acid 6-phosphate etherase [Paracoccus tibetensis]|uniref:N-acetylmuramic acid 6-phosphate etherase n=1 Tax=Paracoccus tibetensis TaxID=336292 RepID=A0A1G5HEQ1_9RHOB|nr:N-acetylmuramic acid 6-phosphate etherase [Paracoccus tibetensis]SCY62315.1 N-acetylmuramic acid 6-phosphate etherase [Paracoccus tibetensis]